MRITSLEELQEYISYTVYKHNKEHDKRIKVYICQPVYYINNGIKNCHIWSGYIAYFTMAKSRSKGQYRFVLDKENDKTYKEFIDRSNTFMKICPIHVNTLLADIHNTDIYELFLTNDNKAIFTEENEAIQYINNIKNGNIKIPVIEHTVKFSINNGKETITTEKLL